MGFGPTDILFTNYGRDCAHPCLLVPRIVDGPDEYGCPFTWYAEYFARPFSVSRLVNVFKARIYPFTWYVRDFVGHVSFGIT